MWFFYASFFALWNSVSILLTKKLTTKFSPLPLLFALNVFSVLSIFLLLVLTKGFPHVTSNFFKFMFISAALDAVAFLAAINAIKISQISLIAPLSSFGPVFTTIIAVFTLGEIPSKIKFVGILLTVCGAYILNVKDVKNGILTPFKILVKNKGALLYLVATLLWAITPIFQKKAIFETSPTIPLFASFFGFIFVTIFISPFALRSAKQIYKAIRPDIKIFTAFGIFTALSQLAAYTAFSLTHVGYVTAIMRMSSLFTIVLGGKFLAEERVHERFVGAIVMLIGTIMIVLI